MLLILTKIWFLGLMDRPMDGPTDTPSYRDVRTHLTRTLQRFLSRCPSLRFLLLLLMMMLLLLFVVVVVVGVVLNLT